MNRYCVNCKHHTPIAACGTTIHKCFRLGKTERNFVTGELVDQEGLSKTSGVEEGFRHHQIEECNETM